MNNSIINHDIQINTLDYLSYKELFVCPSFSKEILNRGIGENIFYIDFGRSTTKGGNLHFDYLPSLYCPTETYRAKRNNIDVVFSGLNVVYESNKNTKNLFDNDFNFDSKAFEDYTDYCFKELNINQNDKLIYSEPIGINKKYRDITFELFFECYGLSEIMPTVDSISSMYHVWKNYKNSNSILVSIGSKSIDIISFIDNNLDTKNIKKINIGYESCEKYYHNLFELKYSNLNSILSVKNIKNIYKNNAFCASNFKDQLKLYQYIELNDIIPEYKYLLNLIDFSDLQPNISLNYITNDEYNDKIEQNKLLDIKKKLEYSNKMSLIFKSKREDKIKKMENELFDLKKFINNKSFNQKCNLNNSYDIESRISYLNRKLGYEKKENKEEIFNLLEIDDKNLSNEQLKQKKIQKMRKAMINSIKEKKILKQKAIEEFEIYKNQNPKKYLNSLFIKRKQLINKIKHIKHYNEDKNIKKQKDNHKLEILDNYLDGKEYNQYDMNIILKEFYELSSDTEKYESELLDINKQIKNIDPFFNQDFDNENIFIKSKFNNNKVFIGSDIIRSTELLFQPYLNGINQMGISETIIEIINSYDFTKKQSLLQNIYILGGGAHIKGLGKRIRNDLFNSYSKYNFNFDDINTEIIENPQFSSYIGVRQFYQDFGIKGLEQWMITKKDYEEYGPNIFRFNPIGNI